MDITAVAAVAANLEVLGYNSQAYFLLACDLDEILGRYTDGDQKQYLGLAQQVKVLMLPGAMGERYKVIGLGRGMATGLKGFAMADHRGCL